MFQVLSVSELKWNFLYTAGTDTKKARREFSIVKFSYLSSRVSDASANRFKISFTLKIPMSVSPSVHNVFRSDMISSQPSSQ